MGESDNGQLNNEKQNPVSQSSKFMVLTPREGDAAFRPDAGRVIFILKTGDQMGIKISCLIGEPCFKENNPSNETAIWSEIHPLSSPGKQKRKSMRQIPERFSPYSL